MSAPPSEAESDVGEVVFIAIKVEGGGDGASAYTPKDNQDIFKSDCIVEIERKWLASEFFEAPTKRWKFDENSQTCLTLLLPEGCVASEGARLLKLRLGSAYFRKKQNPASTAQERAWSPVDWWMATSGRSSSLFGALYLFNYTLQKDFATEVIASHTFGLHLPQLVSRMSAPTSEAGSDVKEVVILAIKVEGGGDVEVAYDPRDDQDFFKSECVVEIDRKWLASEFFQAPMNRWKFDENCQTRLTLLLPEGCVASEGARLLKLRLGSEYLRKKQNPATTTQERAWSPVDWWKATSGRSSSLFGAVYLFDYTLQKDFAVEVAETLKLYCIRCPAWVATIAQERQVDVQKIKLPVEPWKIDFGTFKKLLYEALEQDRNDRIGL